MAIRNFKDEAERKIQELQDEVSKLLRTIETVKARSAKTAKENNKLRSSLRGKEVTIERLNEVNEDLNHRLKMAALGDGEPAPVKVEPKTLMGKFIQGKI